MAPIPINRQKRFVNIFKNDKIYYFKKYKKTQMSIPVRCFTCNKVIGHYEIEFRKCIEKDENVTDFFVKKGINRYCCKRMFNTSPLDIFDDMIECNRKILPEQVKIGETKPIRILKAI